MNIREWCIATFGIDLPVFQLETQHYQPVQRYLDGWRSLNWIKTLKDDDRFISDVDAMTEQEFLQLAQQEPEMEREFYENVWGESWPVLFRGGYDHPLWKEALCLFELTVTPVVWVPACEAGDIVYSLLMLSLEHEIPITIIGTDYSEVLLEKARRGIFTAPATSEVPTNYLKYLEEVPSGLQVVQSLRDCVTFHRQKLIDGMGTVKPDLIIARNIFSITTIEWKQNLIDLFRNNSKGMVIGGDTITT